VHIMVLRPQSLLRLAQVVLLLASYTTASSPGGFTGTATSSPITVTGLRVQAFHILLQSKTDSASGSSPDSAASNSITATTVPQEHLLSVQSHWLETTAGSSIYGWRYRWKDSIYIYCYIITWIKHRRRRRAHPSQFQVWLLSRPIHLQSQLQDTKRDICEPHLHQMV
jgi:hypothetical protein